MPFNLPILLTWLRIVAIPLLIAVYYLPADWATSYERDLVATLLFCAAALTDWADGYLARKLNQTSAFGAFLDPVADKLMVAAALIVLVQLGRADAIVAMIIIGREITISALREWMAKIGASKSVAVSMLGKVKTSAQMLALPMLLFYAPLAGFEDWNNLFYAYRTLAVYAPGISDPVQDEADPETIERARAQIRAQLLMGQESPAARAGQIARQMMLYGRIIPNNEMMERLAGITIERLTDLAGRLFFDTDAAEAVKKADAVFIDATGIGWGVVDRLHQMDVLLARDAEDDLDPLGDQALRDQLGDGAGHEPLLARAARAGRSDSATSRA